MFTTLEQLQVSNPENWLYAGASVRTALPIGGGYRPMEPQELPFLFTSRYLGLFSESLDVPPRWFLGCWVYPRFESGLTSQFRAPRLAVPMNREGVIYRVPEWAGQYSLIQEIPWWLRELTTHVWEYTGPVTAALDSLNQQQLDQIRIDLTRLEGKVDNPPWLDLS